MPSPTLTLLSLLLTLTTSTLAFPQYTPTSEPTLVIAPIATPVAGQASVYICEDADWRGACTHHFVDPGQGPSKKCNALDGRASSIGPDWGWTCYFYTNAVCDTVRNDTKDFVEFTWPGARNVGVLPKGNFDDRFLSFQCVPAKSCGKGICDP